MCSRQDKMSVFLQTTQPLTFVSVIGCLPYWHMCHIVCRLHVVWPDFCTWRWRTYRPQTWAVMSWSDRLENVLPYWQLKSIDSQLLIIKNSFTCVVIFQFDSLFVARVKTNMTMDVFSNKCKMPQFPSFPWQVVFPAGCRLKGAQNIIGHQLQLPTKALSKQNLPNYQAKHLTRQSVQKIMKGWKKKYHINTKQVQPGVQGSANKLVQLLIINALRHPLYFTPYWSRLESIRTSGEKKCGVITKW